MLQRLYGALADLCTRWREAVSAGDGERVAPSVDAVPPLKLKRFVFSRTLKYAALQTVEGFIATYAFLQRNVRTDSLRDWLLIAALLAGLAFVVTLPKFLRLLLLWLRHAPVDGSLRQISLSLRDALCECDLLNGPPKRFPLRFREIEGGRHSIHLQNADFYEQSLFADALAELLGPIQNPRYLLTRAHPSAIRIFQRHPDSHAVPAVLGAQKETAACLHRHWEKRIGPSELLYTRKPENRPLLLKARARAFSTAMTPKAARVDRWV